jgi:hypothetical protein
MTMPNHDQGAMLVCTNCEAIIEVCAFCERVDCPGDVICYRCMRNQLLQSVTTPSTKQR